MNRDDLAREQFSPPPRQDEIIGEVQAIFLEKTRAEWIKAFDPNLVCYAPVNSMEEAFEDPQIRHRGSLVQGKPPRRGAGPAAGLFAEIQRRPTGMANTGPRYW